MRALTAVDVLQLWERCASLHPVDRALAMLQAGWPHDAPEALAALPIGERERRAAALRVHTFGPRCEGVGECPGCGEVYQVDPPIDAILAAPEAPREPVALTVLDHELVVRVPDSRDQAALTWCHDADEALRVLVRRCVLSASRGGQPCDPAALPEAVLARVGDALAAMDENAETLIELACARCEHRWVLAFDAGEFLFREVTARARRLVYEVHTLARSYGWREADILAMSGRRREAYLQMVGR
ncbi:hypothetical protein WME98_45240 [Sorangium sp. So ce296]|uniref:phage baseplate protein n=1 Tax=unclassified Sorangium TaxID=2621164 RepID=UPI003F5BCB90